MAIDEISEHEVRVYQSLSTESWRTSDQVAEMARVSSRTARLHLKRFVDADIAERRHLYPGFRYRLLSNLSPRTHPYVSRLTQAAEVI